MTSEQVRQELRRRAKRAGTQKALAGEIGVAQAYLSDVLNGRREPGPTILEFLGFRRGYEKIKEEQT